MWFYCVHTASYSHCILFLLLSAGSSSLQVQTRLSPSLQLVHLPELRQRHRSSHVSLCLLNTDRYPVTVFYHGTTKHEHCSLHVCLPLVDSLGINNDLKNKLQDVLIPEKMITLGHMLGKGNDKKKQTNRLCLE